MGHQNSRPTMANARRNTAWVLACLAGWSVGWSSPAMAERLPIFVWEEDGQHAQVNMPGPEHAMPPVIIVLPDALSRDARHDRYVEALLAEGFAVLVPQGDEPMLAWLRRRVVRNPALDGTRIGLLAFGGGAAEAVAADFGPRALLYPGCTALPPLGAPLASLLLHGGRDPANLPQDCSEAATLWRLQGATVEHRILPGAGYAWDVEAVGGLRQMLPAPGLQRRIQVAPDPQATEAAVELVVRFLMARLSVPGS